MQINFTPHKIKKAKSYIEKLIDNELKSNKSIKKASKDSFFRKILRLLGIWGKIRCQRN